MAEKETTEKSLAEPKKKTATAKTKTKVSEPKKPAAVDWSKEFDLSFDGTRLDQLLKDHGIKTRQEFIDAGVSKIAAILMALYMGDAQSLTVQVRKKLDKEV